MPSETKGGVYAKSDIPLIREAVEKLLKAETNLVYPDNERIAQMGNLLHRLDRI